MDYCRSSRLVYDGVNCAILAKVHGWNIKSVIYFDETDSLAHSSKEVWMDDILATFIFFFAVIDPIGTVPVSGTDGAGTASTWTNSGIFGLKVGGDGTGTLTIENEAGKATAEELQRSILVAQQMFISDVVGNQDWLERIG